MPDTIVTRDGLTLGFERWGDGKGRPTLLLSGLGMPPQVWEMCGLVEALLAQGRNLVCPVFRGTPPSSTPIGPYTVDDHRDDAIEVASAAFGDGVMDVVGISLGGYVAQRLVLEHPTRVDRLVLIACLDPSPVLRAVDDVELELIDRLGEVPTRAMALEMLLTTLPASVTCDPTEAERWLELFSATDTRFESVAGLAGNLHASREWAEEGDRRVADLGAIDRPTLSIGFEFDLFFPPATTRAAAARIPDGRHITIEGAAHGGLITHGAEMTRLVADFFRALKGAEP